MRLGGRAECNDRCAISGERILGSMAILASVAILADDNADPQDLRAWLDACVLAHVEQGVPYDDADRACRSHIEGASRA